MGFSVNMYAGNVMWIIKCAGPCDKDKIKLQILCKLRLDNLYTERQKKHQQG